jgi:hypothetical protein
MQTTSRLQSNNDLAGARVIIIAGTHAGEEGVCLGKTANGKKWAISPDSSDVILPLKFETDFGLLVDLSGDPAVN